jgi:hypothetical protein
MMIFTLIPFYAVPAVAEGSQPEPVFSVSVSGRRTINYGSSYQFNNERINKTQ